MSYCKTIFNKEIHNLEFKDLEFFFKEEQEESHILEFKSGESQLVDIYKEITAFLNTQGGLLIIGTPRETTNKEGDRVCVGNLTNSDIRGKDWLMQKITSNISPSPTDIKIQELKNNLKIFVLEIPKSTFAPHQVSDKGQYYIRLEREAKPAPHGIVEALFFKRQRPNIECEVILTTNEELVTMDISLSNTSEYTADGIGYVINLGGVEAIISKENISNNFESNGEGIFFTSNSYPSVLVKGLAIPSKIVLKPIDKYVYISVSYYCRDISLRRIVGVYNYKEQKVEEKIKTINGEEISLEQHEVFRSLMLQNKKQGTE